METNGICQYCYEQITYGDSHLDYCRVYKSIMVHLNSSQSSEEELPSINQLCDYKIGYKRLYSKPQVFPLRPMRKSLNCCPQCKVKFENILNLPYVLPSCGHTFCKHCLSRMSYKSMIRCSICSSMTYKELKKLRVNYALLEAIDSSNKKIKCKEHNSEIMAYCNTDDLLICGNCTFDHRAHEVYLLTDPKINAIANSKKPNLIKQEQELLELKEVWEKSKNDMQLGLNELQFSIDRHKKEFENVGDMIVLKIKQGCSQCILDLNKVSQTDELMNIKSNIKENLRKIDRKGVRVLGC